jgi:hypothetical protein
MLPDIGLIVAAYVITRLTAMLGQPNAETNPVAKVFCVIAILITLVSVADLVSHGMSFPST